MTELRFVWPVNMTGHYSKIISSTDFMTFLFTLKNLRRPVSTKWKSLILKKDISITRGRIASRIPLTLDKSKSDAHLNSVYPKKVNSGPA